MTNIPKQVAKALKGHTLDFKPHPGVIGCKSTQATIFFDNGYGASVITGDMLYTSDTHPYEVAVLKGDADDWSLTYDTPITGDVIGHLSKNEVNNLLTQIENLPPQRTK